MLTTATTNPAAVHDWTQKLLQDVPRDVVSSWNANHVTGERRAAGHAEDDLGAAAARKET